MTLRASITAILLSSISTTTACDPSYLDNGRLTRDGFELRPAVLPWLVVAEDSFEHATVVDDAIEWWNGQGVGVLFEGGIDDAEFDALALAPIGSRYGVILASVESIPGGGVEWLDVDEENPNGDALVLDNGEGAIVACDVRVDFEIAYHEPTERVTLIHELGHCLGLADDPESIDLDSCMSSPTYDGCGLTPGDLALLRE